MKKPNIPVGITPTPIGRSVSGLYRLPLLQDDGCEHDPFCLTSEKTARLCSRD